MTHYQVIARRYRPQTFSEVLGQGAVVSTLKNAYRGNKLAHAYLFCGSQGTGKTTLARLLAKLLNCEKPSDECEPCNSCVSCKGIVSGSSLDVLEIDGASHRGIEDIRQINETVGYTAAGGGYKVYIIDEVHMLTKEAFNALLKTLEEPPPKVKFFFATTEVHKVLPTILSRCQQFQLRRLTEEEISTKLRREAVDLEVKIDDEAIHLIAQIAEGGMRDAESTFDQIVAFSQGVITADVVREVLGTMPKESFFRLDRAGQEQDYAAAFAVADEAFTDGRNIGHLVEGLIHHFRQLLKINVGSTKGDSQEQESAALYSREQILYLLDYLVEEQQKIRFAPSQRIALEAILLRIIRSHRQVPVESLVGRLLELEQRLKEGGAAVTTAAPTISKPKPKAKPKQEVPEPKPKSIETKPAAPAVAAAPVSFAEKAHSDTLLQFAAVELDGTIQKKSAPKS
jgi:DNA polymerase-3 subunit gamma/tau